MPLAEKLSTRRVETDGDIIIDQLNQCRKLLQEMQARIYDLVLELLKLRFRIDTQEPIPELNNEELEVDLCYFSVISTFLDDPNPSESKNIFQSPVVARNKKHDQSDRRS
ncbi:7753_t:CDS:2 [Ambispora leptoticha]|uniref:7753_t:CDS:1 n=1 Tax=Ambispora leptoticha TaxID=144679 RepID=A0A9N8W8Y7_9GLOM|nr:7753_t:CDS:2 [Ambispora leptoticha]